MKLGGYRLLAAGLVLTLVTTVAKSQTLQRVDMHHRAGMGHELPFFALHDLTDAQRTQIKQIFQSSRTATKPLMLQEHQSHQAMMQLITGGNFEEAKAQAIASQEAQTHVQLEVEHAKVVSQAYQVLTAEQKTELNEIMAKHEQRMQERMSQHQAPPEQAPNQ
ncbi:MAG TPA: Spy/CpxP family protein refolding chaperone [Terriglobales bacterium]|jgi:Spy/CpxP family protein refolding chaperone|nr:Spy/CpxP family protein refolding chaperone [Terriglobales bacterium]